MGLLKITSYIAFTTWDKTNSARVVLASEDPGQDTKKEFSTMVLPIA